MPRGLVPVRLTDQRVKRVKRRNTKIPVEEVDWLENVLKEALV